MALSDRQKKESDVEVDTLVPILGKLKNVKEGVIWHVCALLEV